MEILWVIYQEQNESRRSSNVGRVVSEVPGPGRRERKLEVYYYSEWRRLGSSLEMWWKA